MWGRMDQECSHLGENTEASKYEMGSGDNRSTIKIIESEKDLGVFIDEKLNFREHIDIDIEDLF